MADIGIKKNRVALGVILGFITFAAILVCAIMWGMYQANYTNAYWIENGIEVQAECVGWYSIVDYNDMHREIYYCEYRYVDSNGKEYNAVQRFLNKENAQSQIGEKITIVIDPNSNDLRHVDLENLKLTYERDFALAIVFCFPVPIALYLLIYRGIYRSVINYKIRKKLGLEENDYIGGNKTNTDAIKTGEVTKVLKWIVCYVKVKYQDENGLAKEKWARSWFTHKEAKFLREKITINIVPYKNTYGILEEMSTTK